MIDNEFYELVKRWTGNKNEMDSYKDAVNEDGKSIKSEMKRRGLYELEVDNFRVVYSERKSEDFNEDKLLTKIKELGFVDCIKTKEYVDMNILENLIYNNEINPSDLLDCKETKVTQVLTLKRRNQNEKY